MRAKVFQMILQRTNVFEYTTHTALYESLMSWGRQLCTTLPLTVTKPQAMAMSKILEKFLGNSNGCVAKQWPIFQSLVYIW